jgi:hypothetical protein
MYETIESRGHGGKKIDKAEGEWLTCYSRIE